MSGEHSLHESEVQAQLRDVHSDRSKHAHVCFGRARTGRCWCARPVRPSLLSAAKHLNRTDHDVLAGAVPRHMFTPRTLDAWPTGAYRDYSQGEGGE